MSTLLGFTRAVCLANAEPLDIEVARGELVVVVVRPECGHALLRAALGFRLLAAGSCAVLGRDPADLARQQQLAMRRRMGAVLRPEGLLSNLPLLGNAQIAAMHRPGISWSEAERRARLALDICGVGQSADLRPPEVTPSVRIMAALARAIAVRPELLLLENVAADLSTAQRRAMLEVCRAHSEATLITATHADPLLLEHADRTYDTYSMAVR